MRRRISIHIAVLGIAGLLMIPSALAQQPRSSRPVITKVIPIYPELARSLKLEGSVKVTVVVAPNGSVKSVQGMGGHPLLLKAAQDAIYKWKWAPSAQESQESVELRFHPE